MTLEIPDSLDEHEAKTLFAAKLYEKGALSLGQAAELAGYSKRTFMELLGNYGVSVFEYSEMELEKDLMNAQDYHLWQSCLILLDKIGEISILNKLFGVITTTSEVAIEFGQPLPSWFEIREPADKNYQAIIEATVDKGEASAIALAIELDDCLLIIDDLKGRKFASQLGLTIIGTIGVIVDAKLAGIIPSVKPILSKIKSTNFRITEQLELLIIKRAGEWAMPYPDRVKTKRLSWFFEIIFLAQHTWLYHRKYLFEQLLQTAIMLPFSTAGRKAPCRRRWFLFHLGRLG